MLSSSTPPVNFFFKRPVSLKQRKKLKSFIKTIFFKEKMPIQSLSFIFCSDKDLLEINRQYLKHDYYTDIISFDLSGKNAPVQGEVYISVDRIRENAKSLNEPLAQELHRVIFHGVLHLCGFKDKTSKQKDLMRKKENQLLSFYDRTICST
jgi:probable rRNA maturation factor